MMNKYLLFCFLILSVQSFAQHTLEFDAEVGSPKAKIIDFAWIAGHWKGEAFGGVVEEVWTPPLGDSMLGSFKLVTDHKTSFYEIEILRELDETVILQLKHFNNDLTGWEEKNETVDFPLIKIEKNKAYFDGMTFHLISENELMVYVVISDSGEKKEAKFHYKRVTE